MEIMTLMKGDMGNVKEVAKRSKEFLKKLIGSKSHSQFAEHSVQATCDHLVVPDSLIEQVGEFDPVDLCQNIMNNNMLTIVQTAVNHQGTDAQFA